MEEKEVVTDWEVFVKSEVEAALDKFLPHSVEGKLGVIYKKSIVEETEAGPVYDTTKKSGVELIISLTFNEDIVM